MAQLLCRVLRLPTEPRQCLALNHRLMLLLPSLPVLSQPLMELRQHLAHCLLMGLLPFLRASSHPLMGLYQRAALSLLTGPPPFSRAYTALNRVLMGLRRC